MKKKQSIRTSRHSRSKSRVPKKKFGTFRSFKQKKQKIIQKIKNLVKSEDKIPLSVELKLMLIDFKKENPTYGDFFDYVKEKGFGFLMMIIALPSAIPVPATGYSIPFAIVLSAFGVQILRKRRTPYFPEWVRRKQFSKKFFHAVFTKFSTFASLLEYVSRPRHEYFFRGPFRILLGLVIIILAIVMGIPFPLSNTFPAMAILLIGFCMLNNDGLLLWFSYLFGIFAIGVAFLPVVIFWVLASHAGL